MTENIVFLDRDTIASFTRLRPPSFDHTWQEFAKTQPDQVSERLKGATIAISNKVPISAEVLAICPDLRLIAMAATGYDVIDIDACKHNGVSVSNIRGYAVNTVPEHTFALILALSRQIIGYREDVKKGEWKKADQFCFFNHKISDLKGKRLIIMGEGSIGQGVAAIARGFGMEVCFCAHKGVSTLGPLYTDWDECIKTGDYFTIHCPLTSDTLGMLGINEFKKMKSSSIVINTARGGLIVEEDLTVAIEEGMIAGAAIDVISEEPPENNSHLIKLMDHPNFILTPHVAWSSSEAMQTLADQLIDNIENFIKGIPSNIVV